MKHLRKFLFYSFAASVLIVGCGGGGDSGPKPDSALVMDSISADYNGAYTEIPMFGLTFTHNTIRTSLHRADPTPYKGRMFYFTGEPRSSKDLMKPFVMTDVLSHFVYTDYDRDHLFAAKSGTLTIKALTGNTITVEFNDVTMQANTAVSKAKGSFRLHGTYVLRYRVPTS